MPQLIQMENQIFDLEQIATAEYKPNAYPTKTSLKVAMAGGNSFELADKQADKIWELLKESALNATPPSEE